MRAGVCYYGRMHTTSCLLCGATALTPVIDLGYHPLADTFLTPTMLEKSEETYPLKVLLCDVCGHTMNSYAVPKEKRYQENEYSYDSSNSRASIAHFAEMATDVAGRVGLGPDDLVVDIGSNVGTLLQSFKEQADCKVHGVEPAANMAALARDNGIPTEERFFDAAAVSAIRGSGPGARVVTITNAWNHIFELDTFMEDVSTLLAPDGVFVAEVPYLGLLVEQMAFDTIYHEHASYFSVRPLIPFLRRHGFVITDLQKNSYMGGSMRITAARSGEESPDVEVWSKAEEAQRLHDPATYKVFMERVQAFRLSLMHELYSIRKNGGRIVGIGAATKGNTLLNYCKIDTGLLEFVTDASALKIGKYTPGSHIPIKPDEAIGPEITHALILPWNIADLLKEKLAHLTVTFIAPAMERGVLH